VQGAAGLKDKGRGTKIQKGRGMLCGHTTCKGFTAVRRSRNGHPEVSRTHRDGDKPGKIFPGLVTSPRSAQTTPPRLHRHGGGWEGRTTSRSRARPRSRSRARPMSRSSARPRCIPPPHLSSMRGFRGMRGKMLRGVDRHRDIKSSGNNGNETNRCGLKWRVAVWPMTKIEQ
jgi:hypothetical protein